MVKNKNKLVRGMGGESQPKHFIIIIIIFSCCLAMRSVTGHDHMIYTLVDTLEIVGDGSTSTEGQQCFREASKHGLTATS